MMLFTHILAGALIGLPAAGLYGSAVVPLVVAGAIGGLVPDIDMVLEHRRTLHFPVIGTGVAIVLLVAGAWMGSVVQLLAVFMAAVAVHSLMDVLGGGKELRPWERTDPRASFDHLHGEWFMARRLVHDGSRGDLLLYALCALPLWYWGPAVFRPWIMVMSVMAAGYTLVRKVFTRYIAEEYASISDVIKAAYRDGPRSVLR